MPFRGSEARDAVEPKAAARRAGARAGAGADRLRLTVRAAVEARVAFDAHAWES